MKIFISSTCYDLIDLRAALAQELRDMGATPLLSDERTSEFEVSGASDENSIQTCLNNVKTSDAVIFVLSQRYGPKLPHPFDPLSATHLEYREAKKQNKRRYVYVRDRLVADFDLWRAQDERSSFKGAWIKSSKDFGLFELLKEHSQLVQDGDANQMNWRIPFANACDLTQDVRKRLSGEVAFAAAEKLIETGRVPFVVIVGHCVNVTHTHDPVSKVKESGVCLNFYLQNAGPEAAVEATGTLDVPGVITASTPESSVAVISPIHSAQIKETEIKIYLRQKNVEALILHAAKSDHQFFARLRINYTTMRGHQLADDWMLHLKVMDNRLRFIDNPRYIRKRVCGHRNFITRESVTVSAS